MLCFCLIFAGCADRNDPDNGTTTAPGTTAPASDISGTTNEPTDTENTTSDTLFPDVTSTEETSSERSDNVTVTDPEPDRTTVPEPALTSSSTTTGTTTQSTTTTKATTTTKVTTSQEPVVTPAPEVTTAPAPTTPEAVTTREPSGTSDISDTTTDTPSADHTPWVDFENYEDNHVGAAAFIGYSREDYDTEDILKLLALPLERDDVTVIDAGGDEWYFILPRYHDSVITLHTVTPDGNGVLVEDALLVETMQPLLIRCNSSDILPSVMVTIDEGGNKTLFYPYVSLENGAPVFPKDVLDITHPADRIGQR